MTLRRTTPTRGPLALLVLALCAGSLACAAFPRPRGWVTVVVPPPYTGMALVVGCPDRGVPLVDDTVTVGSDGVARVRGEILRGTIDVPVWIRRPDGERLEGSIVGSQSGGGDCEYVDVWIGPPGPTPHSRSSQPELLHELETRGGTYDQAVRRNPL